MVRDGHILVPGDVHFLLGGRQAFRFEDFRRHQSLNPLNVLMPLPPETMYR